MALAIDRQDRDTAKREKLYLFQVTVDGRHADADRGKSEISGACTKEQAEMLRGLIRGWDTGSTFKTDVRGEKGYCHFRD